MVLASSDWQQQTWFEPRPTILLGSDSEAAADALATALRSDGYDVLEASNTVEVIDRFNDMWIEAQYGLSPELIILHLTQPPWANLAMLEYIRKIDWAVPVIIVAATYAAAEIREAKRMGATMIFKRPFDVGDLRAAVVNAIPVP